MTKTIKEIAEIILKDPEFINSVKLTLDNMLKDGKINMADIPEMVLLVTLGYNKSSKFTVSSKELPELLTKIAHLIITKYDLVPDESRYEFEKILHSSIKLSLIVPHVKSKWAICLKYIKNLFKCFIKR